MHITELVSVHADLLFVGLAVSGIALLGFLAFFNNTQSSTNRAFLFFSLMTVLWGISNYFEYRFETISATLWALRVHLFISTWHAFAFFTFCYIFPRTDFTLERRYIFGVLPLAAITSVLTLTPLVFSGISGLAPQGEVTNPDRGPGLIVFSVVAFGLLIAGLILLYRKWGRSLEDNERSQYEIVFLGMTVTTLLILGFNVFLPVVLNKLTFIPLAALFVLPVIGSITYAIVRYHLFNTKVVMAQVFSFILCVATLLQIMFSSGTFELLFRSFGFLLVLLVAILFVRSVMNEVKQRETIQKQEEELEVVNAQQVTLLHFISHEIKGYLTKGQNAFAGIVEGDYGETSPSVKTLAEGALREMRKGVDTVMGILEASNLKKGTVTYDKKPFDFKKVVLSVVDDLKMSAEAKRLQLETAIAPTGSYDIVGDATKLQKHVIRNLVDNSIHYTPSGSIKITLSNNDGRIHFSVHDTGVGITPEDMKKLFTEGGHGKDSIKVNVDSTGYGLYIARQIIEAHGGKIWAESEGAGKGSTFIAEIPTAQSALK